jgi:hypothetical protein
MPAPDTTPGFMATLALDGGSAGCPEEWSRDDVLAYIS